MWSNKEVFEYGMSIFSGKKSPVCVIDFVRLYPNLSLEMIKKHGNFRDELVQRYSLDSKDCSNKTNLRCKWTLEIIFSQIIDDVIRFNQDLKSIPESHEMIFVCLDNDVLPYQQALLQRSYINSRFFQFDDIDLNRNSERIFIYLQGKKLFLKKCVNFYPLLLHMNTNNILIRFTFNEDIISELFPLTIALILNTFIENTFLEDYPSTIDDHYLRPIETNILTFNYDPATYRSINGIQTIVTYFLYGVQDFGSIVQQIRIWSDILHRNSLISIQLNDDVRRWNQQYQPCSSIHRENDDRRIIFENREDPTKICCLFPASDIPNIINGDTGVSTMKRTTKDCYDMYIKDPKNHFTDDGEKISKILIVPVYFIILPSSCQFQPSNINELDQTIVKGTIFDPDEPYKIRLAYADNNVLRSHPMFHYNRYLRRTFYYIDMIDDNQQIIRYLFSAEYPFILSILNQLNDIDKRDEYLRFCSILHRLIQIDHLSSSIQLIEFNDQSNSYADFKSLSTQIIEHIQEFYQISDNNDNQISSSSIDTKIDCVKQTNEILLFFTDNAKEDQSILTLINDLKEKLIANDFILEDAQGNLNLINRDKQIIFICLGKTDKKINHLIINEIQKKTNNFDIFRDVFILINDAIKHFPCRFLRSIPYLTFNLQKRSPHLNPLDVEQLIHYLKNMNILSKSYQDNFQDINQYLHKSPLQCTNVGEGCAAACYFNYIKLLISLPAHQSRIQLINNQLEKENLINNKSIFISKWIFLIPSKIQNVNEIISYSLNINQNQQQIIGFQLSLWKSNDSNFVNPEISLNIAGIVGRSYSSLKIYKLTNLEIEESFYFAMEIPAALNGLENQYKNMLSHFNFGYFHPLKQGLAFQMKLQEYLFYDQDQICHSNLIFISIDNSQNMDLETTKIFLRTLWERICLSN